MELGRKTAQTALIRCRTWTDKSDDQQPVYIQLAIPLFFHVCSSPNHLHLSFSPPLVHASFFSALTKHFRRPYSLSHLLPGEMTSNLSEMGKRIQRPAPLAGSAGSTMLHGLSFGFGCKTIPSLGCCDSACLQ